MAAAHVILDVWGDVVKPGLVVELAPPKPGYVIIVESVDPLRWRYERVEKRV